jgi:hypothetical protein
VFFEVFEVGTFFLEVFDVGTLFIEVFDVVTFVLEDLNSWIDGANFGSELLDGVLVLVVVKNQGIEVLGSCGSHLDKGARKWHRGNKRGLEGWVGPRRKKGCQMVGTTAIREKRGIQRDRSQIRVSEMGRVHKTIWVKNDRYHWNRG